SFDLAFPGGEPIWRCQTQKRGRRRVGLGKGSLPLLVRGDALDAEVEKNFLTVPATFDQMSPHGFGSQVVRARMTDEQMRQGTSPSRASHQLGMETPASYHKLNLPESIASNADN